jgi:cation transport ATPase
MVSGRARKRASRERESRPVEGRRLRRYVAPGVFTLAALVGSLLLHGMRRARSSSERFGFDTWVRFWRGQTVTASEAATVPFLATIGMIVLAFPGAWLANAVLSVVAVTWLPWLPLWFADGVFALPAVLLVHVLVVGRWVERWMVGRSWWLLTWPIELAYFSALCLISWGVRG